MKSMESGPEQADKFAKLRERLNELARRDYGTEDDVARDYGGALRDAYEDLLTPLDTLAVDKIAGADIMDASKLDEKLLEEIERKVEVLKKLLP